MIEFLANLPSTNLRIAVGLSLAVLYVLWVMVAAAFEGAYRNNVLPDANIVVSLGTFVLVLNGIDAAQFTAKRITEHKEKGRVEEKTEVTTTKEIT